MTSSSGCPHCLLIGGDVQSPIKIHVQIRIRNCPVGQQQPVGKGLHVINNAVYLRSPSIQDPKKKTVLVYGHLDVQPALKEDGKGGTESTLF